MIAGPGLPARTEGAAPMVRVKRWCRRCGDRTLHAAAGGPQSGMIMRKAADRKRVSMEVVMKSQGEIEAAICEGIRRFELDYMGRGPKDIRAHALGDLLVVRLQGVLTAAEQHLVRSLPAEKGRDLLKQVRTHLIETARPILEAMVRDITGVKVLSLHHDISTVTSEEVVLFTLSASVSPREPRSR
jgi:uncharacterized protein YbcI